MAELKKIPFGSINENIISMEFNENPNIPTANYSDETAKRIQYALAKKMKIDKLQRMIESELKPEAPNNRSDSLGLEFTFKGM